MSLFLKLFETTAEYNAYTADTSNFIKPNVSCTLDDLTTVHYNPYVDPYAGHEYVDLGLPSGTKWATMNVGASSVTDYGNYYQYGKGADDYSVTSGQSVYGGTENPLATSADTAVQVWGGNWHMPTLAQLEELTANTTYQWTTIDGINGGKFTAQNGNYVFFPAAGNWNDGSQELVGSDGYYWSSSPDGSGDAFYLNFFDGYEGVGSGGPRLLGFQVRPVVG